jgi:SAM-dependent methyltransferase
MTVPQGSNRNPEFDSVVSTYDEQLNNGLRLSGEAKEYFAEQRVQLLCRKLEGAHIRSVLDYGCGTGGTSKLLADALPHARVLGVDVSESSLDVARRSASERVNFAGTADLRSQGPFDLVYCNGVFHHILPRERAAALQAVRAVTAANGWFSFWENNPWNPGTRLVMSRIPFDRDAITLSAIEARRLLASGGFVADPPQFHFIFPKALAALRPLEGALVRFPFGGQYHLLCRPVR